MNVDHWMNHFYCKEIYADLLQQIKDYQDRNRGTDDKPNTLVIKSLLNREFGYSESEIETAIKDLIESNYLTRGSTVTSNIFITDEGKVFLSNYHRFKMKGKLAKLTIISKENFVAVIAFISLILSLINLFKK